MKKTIAMAVVAFGLCSALQAQTVRNEVSRTVQMDTITVDYKTRYVSSLWDNIFVEADLAGRVLMGEDDASMAFGKRIKPGFSVGVGKWLNPDFGVRLSFGGARLKGWNKGATGLYAYNYLWQSAFDPVEQYWKEQGVDTRNGYRQDIKYYELNADFLFDLYNCFTPNNRLDRRWTANGYVGIGMLKASSYHGMESNSKVAFRLGVTGNYNITDRLGAHLTVGCTVTGSGFDGELGKSDWFAGILRGSVGLSYRLGRQGYRVVRLVPAQQYAALNNAVSLIREKQVVRQDTTSVVKKRVMLGVLLAPSVVFVTGENTFNEELQMVNVFRIAQYMTENKDANIAVVGNTGTTDERLAHRRAGKVRDILVNKYGIAPKRLVIHTYDVNAKYGVSGYDQSVNFAVMETE